MDELKYELLAEVYGRMEAELIESYLESYEIDVKLFEEAITYNIIPITFGRVQVFVEKENAERARQLLEEYENKTQD
jgi:hypothetical protein